MTTIAYVNYLQDVHQLSGVVKMLENKSQAIQNAKLPIHIFLFTCSDYDHPGIQVLRVPNDMSAWARYCFMAKQIKEKCADFDVVILRKMTYSPMLYWYLRQKSFQLIVEYHTLCAQFFHLSGRKVTSFIDQYSGYLMNRLISGKIVMTHEIGKSQARAYGTQVPIKIMPNGVLKKHADYGCMKAFDDNALTMVFVASQYHAYHGIERVLSGMIAYDGEISLVLHIVGLSETNLPESFLALLQAAQSSSKITLHPHMKSDALKKLYSDCHLGIGTLALHQLPMEEACSLKVREYMRYGLPFIYAGIDTELDGNESFCMQFPDDDSPLNFHEVISFVSHVDSHYDDVSKALSVFLQTNSLEEKMNQYYAFALEVLNSAGENNAGVKSDLQRGQS